jgi:hypothetical protein
MELAESVALIGPASRTHDLHAAIQRFHDLICVNATIKAAKMAADAIRESAPPAQPAPVQEPVAYDKTELNCFAQNLYDQKIREGKRGHYESMFHVIHQCVKKVAPAAKRQWVGLTNDEVNNIAAGCHLGNSVQDAIFRAAAKLKERNT